jgi:hypothetical protein
MEARGTAVISNTWNTKTLNKNEALILNLISTKPAQNLKVAKIQNFGNLEVIDFTT